MVNFVEGLTLYEIVIVPAVYICLFVRQRAKNEACLIVVTATVEMFKAS